MMSIVLPQVAAIANTVSWIKLGIAVAAVLILVFILAVFIPWLQDFRRELRYLNSEIGRTEGREQQHWIKRKKRLIRSILPFCRY